MGLSKYVRGKTLVNRRVNLDSQTPGASPAELLDRSAEAELAELRRMGLERGLRRIEGLAGPRMRVDGREVLMLAGANYLDLAGDARVCAAAREATESSGCAAGGSRLISGNLAQHEDLERELSRFLGSEAALIFSTGYMANLGVLTTLAGADDVIVSDALSHASIIDGCRLSRAEVRVFRHNDPDDLTRVARGLAGFRRRLLVLDGVYSMDGDVARLREMVPIAHEHGLLVVLDDAHGFGVLGADGRGAAELEGVEPDVWIGNLGKALGSFGAYVAGSSRLRDLLINRARSFIFTCGLAPGPVAAALEALRILRSEPWRRKTLNERAEQLREGLRANGFDTGASTTHIVPAIIGENEAVMSLCERALARGIYAQGIRFPSVPEGEARIRFTPTCSHSREDIDDVIRSFAEAAEPPS